MELFPREKLSEKQLVFMPVSVGDSVNSLMLALLSFHHNTKLYPPTKEILFNNYMSLSL